MDDFTSNPSSFFKSLFDFSFSEFITPKIIKFLYILFIILAVVQTIIIVTSAFAIKLLIGLLVLIVSPVIFSIMIILARLFLEIIMIIFRIEADLKKSRNTH